MNEEVLTRFFEAEHKDFVGFCFFKTHDKDLAEDMAQQSYIRAIAYKDKIENVPGFLRKVASNLIIDEWRKSESKNISLDEISTTEDGKKFDYFLTDNSTAEWVDRNDEMSTAKKVTQMAMSLLEPSESKLLTQIHLKGLSIQQIADSEDKTINAISVEIHRARKELARIVNYINPEISRN